MWLQTPALRWVSHRELPPHFSLPGGVTSHSVSIILLQALAFVLCVLIMASEGLLLTIKLIT